MSVTVSNDAYAAAVQMSNLCFNLAQDTKIEERHRDTMRELARQWDAANMATFIARNKAATIRRPAAAKRRTKKAKR